MQSHELLREILHANGIKQVSDKVGLSDKRIYQWMEPTQPQGSGTPNPLDRIESLILATGDKRLAEWVCERSGGFFVQDQGQTEEARHHVMACASELIGEFAAMITLIAKTAEDGVITAEEAKSVRKNW